ncbi:COX15/CtaA family protein [Streptomyces huiliensis]|uniref:COX15/CtaA family protein n=1 Tax=Streptomyces huiliensis TaxID=2876027 RepID=UPI001CBE81FF
MRTPLSWLADRYTLGPRSIRQATFVSVVASIGIIITGGVVRVTGSGLGCTDWPACTGETLAPTAEMGMHGAIEFGNRLLTGVLCAVVGWVIIAARLQRTPMPSVLRGGWAQFWIVVLNAVVGGATVWFKLSPYIVAAHFLAAMLLLTAAVVTWHRARREDGEQASSVPLPPAARTATVALLAVNALLILVGTLATGTGPHAGDSSDVPRMPLNWRFVTTLHGLLGAAVLGLLIYLLSVLPKRGCALARQKTVLLLITVVAQGGVGLMQSLSGLPALAVVLHLFGSALAWAGALQVYLTVGMANSSRPAPAAEAENDATNDATNDAAEGRPERLSTLSGR